MQIKGRRQFRSCRLSAAPYMISAAVPSGFHSLPRTCAHANWV